MFPFRDHNPSDCTPYVVYLLIAANVLVYLTTLEARLDERLLYGHYDSWALFPARVTEGYGYHGLLTSVFVHGGLLHLAGNMLFLWIFGDNLEDQLGHGGFLLFYIACGVGASLIQVMTEPASQVPVVGASGAIAGIMGGYLLLFPKARIDILLILIVFIRVISVPAWVMLGFWAAIQFFGLLESGDGVGGVAYGAHAGGFVVGLVLTIPRWLSLGGTGFWKQTHGRPRYPEMSAARRVYNGSDHLHPPLETLRPRKHSSPHARAPWGPESVSAGSLPRVPRKPRRRAVTSRESPWRNPRK